MAGLAQADLDCPLFGALLSALLTEFKVLGKAAFYFGLPARWWTWLAQEWRWRGRN